MQAFKDYDKIQTYSDFEKIPAGGYVVQIKDAQVRTFESRSGEKFSKLVFLFEIIEGEYKDYYTQQYRSQKGEDRKWKGNLQLYLPKDDGSERDGWTKAAFKTAIEAIEDSNNGYHWDWDERKLKGKTVGVLLRNEEYDFDGRQGWTARPFKFIDAEKVRSGKFTVPKDKPLDGSSSQPAQTKLPDNVEEIIDDDDLPF